MKEEDIPRLHLHISERAVANHNSYDLISGKNVLSGQIPTKFAVQSRYRVAKARMVTSLPQSVLGIGKFLN